MNFFCSLGVSKLFLAEALLWKNWFLAAILDYFDKLGKVCLVRFCPIFNMLSANILTSEQYQNSLCTNLFAVMVFFLLNHLYYYTKSRSILLLPKMYSPHKTYSIYGNYIKFFFFIFFFYKSIKTDCIQSGITAADPRPI